MKHVGSALNCVSSRWGLSVRLLKGYGCIYKGGQWQLLDLVGSCDGGGGRARPAAGGLSWDYFRRGVLVALAQLNELLQSLVSRCAEEKRSECTSAFGFLDLGSGERGS